MTRRKEPFWETDKPDHVFVIAEIGVNHNGKRCLALDLIDVAVDAGADAVKFQTFRTDALVTASAARATYQGRNLGEGGTQADMLRRYELSPDDYEIVLDRCKTHGIHFLSTPFDFGSADFLESLGVECFKVSSGDLNHHALLRHLAAKGRSIILSSGMADLGEIEEALCAIEDVGEVPVAVLHCVSNYPCAPEECNLRAIDTIANAFPHVAAGWSDHSIGGVIGIAAAARDNCKLIEKHFTLDRTMNGPDHKASLEPDELKAFITGIREASSALGSGRKRPTKSELETARVARRVLVAASDLKAGTVLKESDIDALRAGEGLPPPMRTHFVGRRLREDASKGQILSFAAVDGT